MAKPRKTRSRRRSSTAPKRRAAPARPKRPKPPRPAPPAQDLLDMGQAIELLKTSRPTFYRWLRAGKIKGMKVGRQWRFYRQDVERFLKGQEPRIELPADLQPLIAALADRLSDLGVRDTQRTEANQVLRACMLMIRLGVTMRASDMHLEACRKAEGAEPVALLRYRVDGVLHPAAELDVRLLPAIIERWRIMADCDVHERARAQDGRILVRLEDAGKLIDLRVCFVPAALGVSLTARVLDPDVRALGLEAIGYAPADRQKLLRCIEAPWGMTVVTGPTGCGKTTVLYACLDHLAGPDRKVMSVEDPVEYLLPWVVQVPVRQQEGVTFASAARAFLRSAPNVIMIGELRDFQTLQVAHQAALTGHLVLTTLHANDAPLALQRMVEMGSEPFVVADSVRLIIAQRLVRRLCTECSVEAAPRPSHLEMAAELARSGGLDWDALARNFRQPGGCGRCSQTGFRGRTVIAEVLEMTPRIGEALRRGASTDELRALAIDQGMTTMPADGVRRAAAGDTSLEEVLRVLPGP